MTLPASDAFSLGLAHDQRRRSISRTRTPSIPRRSSSPKISFTSPSPSLPSTPTPAGSATPFSPPLTSAMGAKRGHKRKASSRQETQHSGESTIEELVEEVDARIAARERKLEAAGSLSSKKHVRNGSASSATTTTGVCRQRRMFVGESGAEY
ncbi:hypothetical protein PAXINDRAFT_98772 [Paxillus involutus ATCC 200175]|nr:hypothetical protein PAXINDRAFT_98772 [Paxillus involutus ATCC 200175]